MQHTQNAPKPPLPIPPAAQAARARGQTKGQGPDPKTHLTKTLTALRWIALAEGKHQAAACIEDDMAALEGSAQ